MALFSVFAFFRDSGQRRAALRAEAGSAERYCLFGLDQLAGRGVACRHNLELGPVPAWAGRTGELLNRAVCAAGGYGGDFGTAVAHRARANRADVVLSTVDTVGLPLALLKHAGVVRPPLVYLAVGLPERLAALRGERVRRLYAGALRSCAAIAAYSELEVESVRWFVGAGGPPVSFVPFGVDTSYFRPASGARPEVDVVSIGSDPHRDFELLLGVASRLRERTFRLVTTADRARALGAVPANVALETEIPFSELRDRLARGRIVALPVRENSYSGATTVLLQAMATARPVVVSRTEAIARGYGLVDGENCRLVPPGDAEALERALVGLLRDEAAAAAMGVRARASVERSLSWERYVDAIYDVLAAAARRDSCR